ncbi:MAG: FtsX-like permease family protein [Clostridiales bacterium]|nr:FtsX-like permease family protein [Clostridiales bacterium]
MQALIMALKSISGNKMRSFLTMLGIIIGVMAIVVLIAIGQGANAGVVSNIEQMGTNLLTINLSQRRSNPVTLEKLQGLSQEAGIAHVAPTASSRGSLKAGLITYDDASLIGTVPGYDSIRNWSLRSGRFITQPDLDNRSFVAVVGQEVAVELFGSVNALGQSFSFQGYSFQVVGVLDEIGSSMAGSGDNIVIIPFTLAERLFGAKGISTFYVSAQSADLVSTAEASVTAYMDRLISAASSSTTYSIYNQSAMLESLNSVTNTLTLMLGGIAGISLLVGGIGIMNIMLVSVSERTREIGIRKAIGASRRNILSQFLIESLVVSLLGGLIGLALSFLLVDLLMPILQMTITVSPVIAAAAVAFSMIIGVVFGLYPANKASALRPIEALRFE